MRVPPPRRAGGGGGRRRGRRCGRGLILRGRPGMVRAALLTRMSTETEPSLGRVRSRSPRFGVGQIGGDGDGGPPAASISATVSWMVPACAGPIALRCGRRRRRPPLQRRSGWRSPCRSPARPRDRLPPCCRDAPCRGTLETAPRTRPSAPAADGDGPGAERLGQGRALAHSASCGASRGQRSNSCQRPRPGRSTRCRARAARRVGSSGAARRLVRRSCGDGGVGRAAAEHQRGDVKAARVGVGEAGNDFARAGAVRLHPSLHRGDELLRVLGQEAVPVGRVALATAPPSSGRRDRLHTTVPRGGHRRSAVVGRQPHEAEHAAADPPHARARWRRRGDGWPRARTPASRPSLRRSPRVPCRASSADPARTSACISDSDSPRKHTSDSPQFGRSQMTTRLPCSANATASSRTPG